MASASPPPTAAVSHTSSTSSSSHLTCILYSIHIYNRWGQRIFRYDNNEKRLSPSPAQAGADDLAENDQHLHALTTVMFDIMSKLPADGEGLGAKSLTTSHYKLHVCHTPTGYKFVMITSVPEKTGGPGAAAAGGAGSAAMASSPASSADVYVGTGNMTTERGQDFLLNKLYSGLFVTAVASTPGYSHEEGQAQIDDVLDQHNSGGCGTSSGSSQFRRLLRDLLVREGMLEPSDTSLLR